MKRVMPLRIDNVSHFNLERTFECGQCFRWQRETNGSYTGIVESYVANIAYDGSTIYIDSNNQNIDYWMAYLDLNRDYAAIEDALSNDPIMKKAISSCSGIRILKQPIWECLISFILSQNNNIPRIKKIIESLCQLFGDKIMFKGNMHHAFPRPQQLFDADLAPIKAGFRTKYLLDAINKIISGEMDLLSVWHMNLNDAQVYLQKVKGIGNKVADCILLYAYQRFDVFPKDVWIKRTVTDLYQIDENEIESFASNHFRDYCGFAQQYLFYQARG